MGRKRVAGAIVGVIRREMKECQRSLRWLEHMDRVHDAQAVQENVMDEGDGSVGTLELACLKMCQKINQLKVQSKRTLLVKECAR
jgi:hypothetical protein